ncbi:MAG: ACP S-malonyltransferase [Eubacteriales bacterium]|nr:ACP S-malonyltransferase [Eubacteriales bacterium]
MGKTAFLFAGQGAQAPGMGEDFYKEVLSAQKIYDMGENIKPGVMDTCFRKEGAELNKTQNAQPCLFLTDLAIAESLKDEGIVPDAVAGFSLGEIPAMAFAGVMPKEEAFRFVLTRAENMAQQSEKHPGGMAAALKLDRETVDAVCSKFKEMWAVNYNCPGQIACSGSNEELDAFIGEIKALGGRAVKLAVSGAFHTPYMNEVCVTLEKFLSDCKDLKGPDITLYSNLTGDKYTSDRATIIRNLSSQVCSPVQWETILRNMWEDGVDTFIEVGAGQTLTGFVKRTLPDAKYYTVNDVAALKALGKETVGV